MDRRGFLKTTAGLFIPAAPALITCPSRLEAGFQSRDSNYNQNIAASGGLGLQTNLNGFWSFENTSWTDDTAALLCDMFATVMASTAKSRRSDMIESPAAKAHPILPRRLCQRDVHNKRPPEGGPAFHKRRCGSFRSS
jgi:hypothetical protein